MLVESKAEPPLYIARIVSMAGFFMPKSKQVERIRGRALQRMRARYFSDNPLCVICAAAGCVTVSTELDHIVALCNGGTNDYGNLQGLCRMCHEAKTRRDLGQSDQPTFNQDGRINW